MKSILEIDISELQHLMDGLKMALTIDQYHQLMYRVMQRAATRTKTLVKQSIPPQYHGTTGWVGAALGEAIITTGPEVGCVIPVKGTRGLIGRGGPFKASGTGANGNRIRSLYEGRKGKRKRRAYKISAQIVKSGASSLPTSMDADRTHIMLFGKNGNSGGVYVLKKGSTYMATEHRRTKTMGVRTYRVRKTSVATAVGIGVPQMPMNRSADTIQAGIVQIVQERIAHEHWALMNKFVH